MTNREEVTTKRVAEAGPLYRSLMLKAYAGDCSPRSAIKAACLICVAYDRAGVRDCTGYSCPLWTLRPYQIEGVGVQDASQRAQASAEGGA